MIVYSPADKQISALSHLKEALQSRPGLPAPGHSLLGSSLLPTFPHLLPLIAGVPRSLQQLRWEARSLHGKTPRPSLRHSRPVCPGLCPEGAEAALTEKWGLGSLSCDLGDYSPAAFKYNLPSLPCPAPPSPFPLPTQPHSIPPLLHHPLAPIQETLEPMPTCQVLPAVLRRSP